MYVHVVDKAMVSILQVVLFCLAVGRNLEGVKVTYVNSDVGAGGTNVILEGVTSSINRYFNTM